MPDILDQSVHHAHTHTHRRLRNPRAQRISWYGGRSQLMNAIAGMEDIIVEPICTQFIIGWYRSLAKHTPGHTTIDPRCGAPYVRNIRLALKKTSRPVTPMRTFPRIQWREMSGA